MAGSDTPSVFRFAGFELDVARYELRNDGRPIRLERRPMELLILLLERRGELVSRNEIVRRLWSEDADIDVDMGINTAIRKVRRALNDRSGDQVFIETVPGKGYRFAADVAVVATSSGNTRVTLAVLPFVCIGDANYEYVADGMTEETIVALGQVDPVRLTVAGRTSVLPYKGTMKALNQIGAELGADYLVEGSVRAGGRHMRVTARLIDARTQSQVWSGGYDSDLSGMLDVQRELGMAIADAVRVRVAPETYATLSRRHTRDPEAYDLYLRGRHFWNQLTPATTRRALESYKRATARDGAYALAWSGLADALASSPITSDAPPREVAGPANDAVTRALRAQPDLAEVQTSSAFVDFFINWQWVRAEAAYREAIELDPNYALAWRMLGVLLSHSRRHDEARAAMRRARELDIYAMYHALSAMIELHARDYEAAARFARQATVIAPDFWIGHYHLGEACERLGEMERALDALDSAERCVGGNCKVIGVRGYILARLGRTHDAETTLAALDGIARKKYVPPYAWALVLAGMMRYEEALDWLERAYEARDVHLIFLPVDPKWDELRSHERFLAVLRRCAFRPELEAAQGQSAVAGTGSLLESTPRVTIPLVPPRHRKRR